MGLKSQHTIKEQHRFVRWAAVERRKHKEKKKVTNCVEVEQI